MNEHHCHHSADAMESHVHMHDINMHTHNHDVHAGHSPEMFKKKFWVAVLLTIPTLVFSQTIQQWLHISLVFPGSEYIPAVFGTVLFLYGGIVFLRSARHELAQKQPGMMTLISMAISVAFIYSMLVTFRVVDGMDFWWELASLITIMLLGHWLEMAAIHSASNAVGALEKLLPDMAEVEHGHDTHKVLLTHVKIGDIVIVRPGAHIPVDGTVVSGESTVNEAMLTGESTPVKKKVRDQVTAGTMNIEGALRVLVDKDREDMAISKIAQLVKDAQMHKSHTQVLADRAAAYLFYIAGITAVATAIGWTIAGDSMAQILERVVTVLVIACPHALGLAVPLVVSLSTNIAARRGIIIRDRKAFEEARRSSIVLFDKTGTLTTGEQSVVRIHGDENRVLRLAASVERDSEHSIAKAIHNEAKKRKLVLAEIKGFRAIPGVGVEAKVNGVSVAVGGEALLQKYGLSKHKIVTKNTIAYVIEENDIIGSIEIGDQLRDSSLQAVKTLQDMNIAVAMVTGDNEAVAQDVAKKLGIERVYAGVLPGEKSRIVKDLQGEGNIVLFTGDGVNDSPALAQANVGVAIGAGTDVAIESAGILLVGSDPLQVANSIKLSRATYRKMRENLLWGAGYNVVALPLAAGLFAFAGFSLSPAAGAVVMSLSTIIVALNAQTLRRFGK